MYLIVLLIYILIFNVEIRPFPLWAFHDVEEALCPVRALANWISLSGVSSGYLFRAPGSRNRQPSFLVDKPLVRAHTPANG